MSATDVCVIGAGIVGVSVARQLARRGLAVTIVERQAMPAAGSTGRSAAGVRVQFSEEVNVALSAASIAEYRSMPQAGYVPAGYLFLVPPEALEAQREAVAMQRALGHDVRLLTPAQAAAHVTFDDCGIEAASWCADDGFVDPHGITGAWLADARAAGARLRLSTTVTSIDRLADGWAVDTDHGTLHARLLINAAGAWAGEIGRMAGLRIPVGPARRMVYSSGPRADAPRLPMTIDLSSGLWLRSEGARLIFGLANPQDCGFVEGVDWEWLERVYDAGARRFPWFDGLTLDRRASWWGYYEVTPDHQPIVGPMPGAPGWLNACGFSGHGVQQAAAIGRIVGELAVGERASIDVSSLSIERFERGGRTPTGERLVV